MSRSKNIRQKIGKTIKIIVFSFIGILILIAIAVAIIFPLVNQTNGEIVSSGERRKYLLYVPASYDPATPSPLIISMHGFAEWPAHIMEISHWNELADEHGLIVVYPAGTGFPLRWRASAFRLDDEVPLTDVKFIADLIDELMQTYNIDETRIYANGLSNGGGMAYLLACKLSDRIAAIGGVAGAYMFPWDDCHPTRPVPLIAFHGSNDRIVPYGGGESRPFEYSLPIIPDWVMAWGDRNGCDEQGVQIPATGGVSGIQYTNCDQDADVILYTIAGGGHTWPGGKPIVESIVGHTTQEIDATRVMWEFFQDFTLEH